MPWEPGTVEATVDQRALVDKVLARYAGQFDLFRELLQNSDDANSSTVEVHFKTSAYRNCGEEKRDVLTDFESKASHWTVKNNGDKFSDSDWERLRTIASGNPDPRKIGAFGVGFYVVFSKTDSPVVFSGGRAMKFYWHCNQLSAECSHAKDDSWTVFDLPLREPARAPPLLELMRFLAISITFMVNLQDVQVFYNGYDIGCIKKSISPLQTIPAVSPTLKEGFMTIQGIQQHSIAIQAKIDPIVYGTIGVTQHHAQKYKSTVDLLVFTADVNAAVPPSISEELYRATKKHPPRDFQYSLVYAATDKYEQDDPSGTCFHKDKSVFQGFHACKDGQSLIFIGHATAQRTGLGGHIMSRFIPTVERELIDLGDGAASVWNRELLCVGGLLCRAIYEWDLTDIQRFWPEDGTPETHSISGKKRDQLHQRFLGILDFFTCPSSAPSQEVSELLRSSFCQGSSKPLLLLSSCGVHPSSCVKAYDRDLGMFLKHTPMLSESATTTGARIMEMLLDQHRVHKITLPEVFTYLRKHSLTSKEMVSCLSWWIKLDDNDQASNRDILTSSATLKRINGSELQLSSVRYFIDSEGPWSRITLDGPLPETLLPRDISKDFARNKLEKLGWKEFTVVLWLEHLSDPSTVSVNQQYDFTRSRDWVERVLAICAGMWPSLSEKIRNDVKDMLETKHCIPTAESLSPPGGTYLPDVNHRLSGDFNLPVVQFKKIPIDAAMRNFLSFIGVQTHTPLKLVWVRQVDNGKWSVYDFIHYVVQTPYTAYDLQELKEREIFPNDSEGSEKSSTARRCRADELYPPVEEFRRLGLRMVRWGQPQWTDESEEAKFMYRLGLRDCPPLETIIELCSSQSEAGRIAFEYLCANLGSRYSDYRPNDFREQAFVPAEIEGDDKYVLRKLGEVFSGSEWKQLGFAVVPDHYRDMPLARLGVQKDPPSSMLISSLEPPKKEIALKWLEVLSKHISIFTQAELKKLSTLDIVPTGPPGKQELRSPKRCYLGKPLNYGFYSSIFDFVDFDPDVIHFLRTCGSKDGPSITDVADALIADPQRFYNLAKKDRFLAELRQLAHHNNHFPCDTMYKLCCKPTLLGEKRERADGQGQWKYHYELQKPEDIVIADDDNDYQLFAEHIFVAPRDDEPLQAFYESLGCERLSKLVYEQRRRENLEEVADPETWSRMEVRNLIQQRLPLFLQKCTHAGPNIDWLHDFNIRVWKTLSAPKVFRLRRRDPIIRQQDIWAVMPMVHDSDSGQAELWLSAKAPKDMYQLATCLCRKLFGTAKDKDTFFLESILSAEPEVLEGRGFIVEPAAHQVRTEKKGHPAGVTPSLARAATDPDRVVPCINPVEGGGAVTGIFTRSLHAIGDTVSGVLREGVMPWKTKNSTQLITRDDIENKIAAAIKACHAGNGKPLDSSPGTTQFNSHYCEVDRPGEDLKFVRRVAGIEIHLPQGGYCMDLARHESLARFIQIITPIVQVFGLSTESLRIFSDSTPGRIAFNRDGRLFVNLLHFEKWHDQAVAKGDRQQCQLSWFLTLTHEIAHNINHSHNAEHEFWFSDICEAFFIKFAQEVLFK